MICAWTPPEPVSLDEVVGMRRRLHEAMLRVEDLRRRNVAERNYYDLVEIDVAEKHLDRARKRYERALDRLANQESN